MFNWKVFFLATKSFIQRCEVEQRNLILAVFSLIVVVSFHSKMFVFFSFCSCFFPLFYQIDIACSALLEISYIKVTVYLLKSLENKLKNKYLRSWSSRMNHRHLWLSLNFFIFSWNVLTEVLL